MEIIKLPSPNYHVSSQKIKAIVYHGTAGSLWASINWLRNPQPNNPKARVSANYVVGKEGGAWELVDWLAGRRAWANNIAENWDKSVKWLVQAIEAGQDLNSLTVSIEHEATTWEMEHRASMTDAQFSTSIELSAMILHAAGLKATHETMLSHSQISGTRKFNCPGVIFVPAYQEQLIKRHPELA